MIDYQSRQRVLNKQRDNQLISTIAQQQEMEAGKTREGLLNIVGALFSKVQQSLETLSNKKIEFPKVQEIKGKVELENFKIPAIDVKLPPQDQSKLVELINLFKSFRIALPKLYRVEGKVDIREMPDVKVTNFPDISPGFEAMASGLSSMEQSIVKALLAQKFEVPKSMSIKDDVSMKGMGDLLEYMDRMIQAFNLLIKATKESKGLDSKTPMAVEIIGDRVPRPVANPVTNISINALGGVPLSTAVTVTSTATPLPASALANRRGLVIYNNGSSTVFVGGSGVTSSSGMPVPAGTYGPALEAGSNMIYYGITASGSVDVRVLEYSDIATGRTITLPGQ